MGKTGRKNKKRGRLTADESELCRVWYRYAITVAFRLKRPDSLTEEECFDLAVDALLVAARTWDPARPDGRKGFSSWLSYVVTKWIVRAPQARARSHGGKNAALVSSRIPATMDVVGDTRDPADALADNEYVQHLREHLSEMQQAVVHGLVDLGRSTREVAATVGLTTAGVNAAFRSAIRKMRDKDRN